MENLKHAIESLKKIGQKRSQNAGKSISEKARGVEGLHTPLSTIIVASVATIPSLTSWSTPVVIIVFNPSSNFKQTVSLNEPLVFSCPNIETDVNLILFIKIWLQDPWSGTNSLRQIRLRFHLPFWQTVTFCCYLKWGIESHLLTGK